VIDSETRFPYPNCHRPPTPTGQISIQFRTRQPSVEYSGQCTVSVGRLIRPFISASRMTASHVMALVHETDRCKIWTLHVSGDDNRMAAHCRLIHIHQFLDGCDTCRLNVELWTYILINKGTKPIELASVQWREAQPTLPVFRPWLKLVSRWAPIRFTLCRDILRVHLPEGGSNWALTNPGGFIDGVSLVSSILQHKSTSVSPHSPCSINKTKVHHEPAATGQYSMASLFLWYAIVEADLH
jgi:hypothetical protein